MIRISHSILKSPTLSQPKYKEIADIFQQQIDRQERRSGDLLPTEKELMTEFGVSRVTVRKALALLEEKDLLTRIRGKGTYISGEKLHHNAFELTGFIEDVTAQGKRPGSKVIQFELITANEYLSKKLDIDVDDQVYALSRLRLINDEPEVLEKTYMSVAMFPDLSVEVLNHSKYEYIEKQKGLEIALSKEVIVVEIADEMLASQLNININHPVLKVISTGELKDGRPFEFSENYFSLKQFSYQFTAIRKKS